MMGETAVSTEDKLQETLHRTWVDVRAGYDFIAPMPDVSTLFARVSLSRPYQAAETVLVNMLVEAVESVDRFSPWYTEPAAAFGLCAVPDTATQQVRWRLSEAGCRRWWPHVERLAAAIAESTPLLEAMILVAGLLASDENEARPIMARCRCRPPRYIRVRKAILNKTEIVCGLCNRPFYPA